MRHGYTARPSSCWVPPEQTVGLCAERDLSHATGQVDGVSCRLRLPNSLGLTYVQHSKLDYAGLPILGLHLCLVSSLAAQDTCEF